MPSFSTATEDDDEIMACIFYNGFLHVWDANWMQALSEPLPDKYIKPSDFKYLTRPQSARVAFYLALIKITRLVSGTITVTIPATAASDPNPQPSAALLWFPPHTSLSLLSLIRSGFLYVMFFHYGLCAVWNLLSFERDLDKLNLAVLSPLGYKKEECGFPFLIATDPAFRGKGHAAQLLQNQIDIHKKEFPGIPVVLDTTTDQAQKVYERLGFRFLGRTVVHTRADADGIRLKSGEAQGEYWKRVMILE